MAKSSQPISNSDILSLSRYNQSIIEHSSLRVILMCGKAVKDLVVPPECAETRLELESGEFPLFLAIEKESIRRIYILIPNPVDALLLRDWRKTHKISESLHLVAAITKVEGIRPYAGDNRCVMTKIIQDSTDKRRGNKEPLSLENLHPMVRLWLTRRGFSNDEDISLLQEKSGGTLSYALLVLLHVAPRHHQNASTTSSISSFHRSEKTHAPEFKIDKTQLNAVKDLCDKLNADLSTVHDFNSHNELQNMNFVEDEMEQNIGEADVLEREALENSEICLDNKGSFQIASDSLIRPLVMKKSREGVSDRNFTIGDQTRVDLLHGREYSGTKPKPGLLRVTVHSCIELVFHMRNPPQKVVVKAEIKPPGQRHPNIWAQKATATDPGSRLGFCVTYTDSLVKKSLYATSNSIRDLYRANSFVHWMEGESVTDIIKRPRQFVVVSSLTKTLPEGIPRYGSFYTDDSAILIPANDFNSRPSTKRKRSE